MHGFERTGNGFSDVFDELFGSNDGIPAGLASLLSGLAGNHDLEGGFSPMFRGKKAQCRPLSEEVLEKLPLKTQKYLRAFDAIMETGSFLPLRLTAHRSDVSFSLALRQDLAFDKEKGTAEMRTRGTIPVVICEGLLLKFNAPISSVIAQDVTLKELREKQDLVQSEYGSNKRILRELKEQLENAHRFCFPRFYEADAHIELKRYEVSEKKPPESDVPEFILLINGGRREDSDFEIDSQRGAMLIELQERIALAETASATLKGDFAERDGLLRRKQSEFYLGLTALATALEESPVDGENEAFAIALDGDGNPCVIVFHEMDENAPVSQGEKRLLTKDHISGKQSLPVELQDALGIAESVKQIEDTLATL